LNRSAWSVFGASHRPTSQKWIGSVACPAPSAHPLVCLNVIVAGILGNPGVQAAFFKRVP